MEEDRKILAQFKDENGVLVKTPFDIPITITPDLLQSLCNALIAEEETSYEFFIGDHHIDKSVKETLEQMKDIQTERLIEIQYQPQARFKVHPVTRCTSSMPGHTEAVIAVSFSPDGRNLASGSGDCTVRLWDTSTETPHYVCKAHSHWILSIAWSPDGKKIASGCKAGKVCIWDPVNGKQLGKSLTGHRQWITWLSWKPFHQDPECRLLASSSKDSTIHIWDTTLGQSVMILTGHSQSVTCVRWGGEGLIYTSSHDRTVKVWRDHDGVLCRTLQGHAHWVNTLCLNTDYVIRTGPFDHSTNKTTVQSQSLDDMQRVAISRYNEVKERIGEELLVSGSDDFTLFLWQPATNKKPLCRMTGHQQLVNQVCFSPDARLIASASFDKSVKLWDGKTGKYIASLRGHVSAVYQISWSADSRLLCSGSSDSTLKLWDVKNKKLLHDLPGHADEVFSVDWSPSGEQVASGGRDRHIKMWRR